MKKFLVGITVFNFVAIIFFLLFSFTTKPKVAYVDSSRLLNEYKGMQNARKLYQSKAAIWKANIDTLTNEVHKQMQEYQKDKKKMSAKEEQLYKTIIDGKQKQLVDYQRAISTQAIEEEAKMTAAVVSQINSFLRRYGNEQGFEIIIGATGYGNVVYAADRLEITEEVLYKLNNESN